MSNLFSEQNIHVTYTNHIQNTISILQTYSAYRHKLYSERNVYATDVFGATFAIFNIHVRNVNPLSENNISVTDKNHVQTAVLYDTGANLAQNTVSMSRT